MRAKKHLRLFSVLLATALVTTTVVLTATTPSVTAHANVQPYKDTSYASAVKSQLNAYWNEFASSGFSKQTQAATNQTTSPGVFVAIKQAAQEFIDQYLAHKQPHQSISEVLDQFLRDKQIDTTAYADLSGRSVKHLPKPPQELIDEVVANLPFLQKVQQSRYWRTEAFMREYVKLAQAPSEDVYLQEIHDPSRLSSDHDLRQAVQEFAQWDYYLQKQQRYRSYRNVDLHFINDSFDIVKQQFQVIAIPKIGFHWHNKTRTPKIVTIKVQALNYGVRTTKPNATIPSRDFYLKKLMNTYITNTSQLQAAVLKSDNWDQYLFHNSRYHNYHHVFIQMERDSFDYNTRSFKVRLTPKPGHSWADGTNLPQTIPVTVTSTFSKDPNSNSDIDFIVHPDLLQNETVRSVAQKLIKSAKTAAIVGGVLAAAAAGFWAATALTLGSFAPWAIAATTASVSYFVQGAIFGGTGEILKNTLSNETLATSMDVFYGVFKGKKFVEFLKVYKAIKQTVTAARTLQAVQLATVWAVPAVNMLAFALDWILFIFADI